MKRCVIDTNVLITANKRAGLQDDDIVLEYPQLVENCINSLNAIRNNGICVTLDFDDEIFDEYKSHMNFSGQPGVGDMFFKWLHYSRYSFPDSERVKLHQTENGYEEFPLELESVNVDPSDKKFFAVSNAHPKKPEILQATDTKWWGYATSAWQCGIKIRFMDEQYVIDKLREKA